MEQKYLLVCLIEECSEVIKEATKILRFGPHCYHPDDPDKKPNIERLNGEVIDLLSVVNSVIADSLRAKIIVATETPEEYKSINDQMKAKQKKILDFYYSE